MRKRHELATLTYKCVRELSNRGADKIWLIDAAVSRTK